MEKNPLNGPSLRPFFPYFGSKWRLAPKYPEPLNQVVIEPFAGSAGYSLRYPSHRVRLYDKDPVIAGLWEYLIAVSEEEILSLPLMGPDDRVDELDICQEAKWLLGFWINKGCARPMQTLSTRALETMELGKWGSVWSEKVKRRIANQLPHIRHWTVSCEDYRDIIDRRATWFVDPPYQIKGGSYTYGPNHIDYSHLGQWCRSLQDQVIVCENEGADWLPFTHLGSIKTSRTGHRSEEVVWMRAYRSEHGLRRSREDKRRAVHLALSSQSGASLSARELARMCGVSHTFASALRREYLATLPDEQVTRVKVNRNGKSYLMETGGIGRGEPKQDDPTEQWKKSFRTLIRGQDSEALLWALDEVRKRLETSTFAKIQDDGVDDLSGGSEMKTT